MVVFRFHISKQENFLFIFDFSISNGYLGNLVMMLGPQVFFQENIPKRMIYVLTKKMYVLRWPRFEMNRSELPPCWSPFLFLASALAPSCPIPSWTLCDKNLQDLAFLIGWGFATTCSPTQCQMFCIRMLSSKEDNQDGSAWKRVV